MTAAAGLGPDTAGIGPIGVFDSGLGGLTALRRLRALAPGLPLIYFGDTARVPYGTRDADTLIGFARQNIAFLQRMGATQVLIACGTISSVLPKQVWSALPLPCLGVVEAAVNAALVGKPARVGILATPATIRSDSYAKALRTAAPTVQTVSVACPDFVPLIEAGKANSDEMRCAAAGYLAPVLQADCDTVILGCTHYPLAAPVLQRILGDQVRLIDAGGTAAEALLQTLPVQDGGTAGPLTCYVSGDADAFAARAAALVGDALALQVQHVDIG